MHTTSCGVASRRWRIRFDEMNPAPPVTRTRLLTSSELLFDRVQGPAFDTTLDPGEVLADQREHEALHTEHCNDSGTSEQRPREVRLGDPVDDTVDAESGGREGTDDAEGDADPLHRLRP